MRTQRKGFTLVELLVVIGIIAVLMSILLPSIGKARQAASTIKCANNLRQVGQGVHIYLSNNNGYFPPSYGYRDSGINAAGVWDASKAWGYQQWSGFILGTVSNDAFKCPAMPDGGVPATNPKDGDLAPGQTPDNTAAPAAATFNTALNDTNYQNAYLAAYKNANGSFADDQAGRLAYAVNEALFARPKFSNDQTNSAIAKSDVITHATRMVNINEVKNSAGVIMASEYVASWALISGKGNTTVVKSHRPLTPFRTNAASVGDLDKNTAATADLTSSGTVGTPLEIRRVNAKDLWRLDATNQTYDILADVESGAYAASGANRSTRLDLVGRNHPGDSKVARDNKTNFLYVDGHVETKSILDTVPAKAGDLSPWEWGDKCYSIPETRMATPATEVGF